jgi:hypothetical protein
MGGATIEPLIDALLNRGESGIFRSMVADTLAAMGSPKAIGPLISYAIRIIPLKNKVAESANLNRIMAVSTVPAAD